jgi:hypothetical protein
MKHILAIQSLVFLSFMIALTSCNSNEVIAPPLIKSVTLYQPDRNKKDSLVEIVSTTKPLIIKVETDAELSTAWPAGDRVPVKSRMNATNDSVDVFKKVVLTKSDDYQDYGLVGARGLVMSGTPQSGYTIQYGNYKKAGKYELVIVATKHGFKSPQAESVIFKKSVEVK